MYANDSVVAHIYTYADVCTYDYISTQVQCGPKFETSAINPGTGAQKAHGAYKGPISAQGGPTRARPIRAQGGPTRAWPMRARGGLQGPVP